MEVHSGEQQNVHLSHQTQSQGSSTFAFIFFFIFLFFFDLQIGEFSGTTLLLTHPSLTSMVMHHSATRWRQRAAQTPTLESSIPQFQENQ